MGGHVFHSLLFHGNFSSGYDMIKSFWVILESAGICSVWFTPSIRLNTLMFRGNQRRTVAARDKLQLRSRDAEFNFKNVGREILHNGQQVGNGKLHACKSMRGGLTSG
jgi:hypothetical protein